MNTQKKLFLTIAILCFGYMATAQRGVRIGYIDMEYILESVPAYREASIQLEGKVQRWKQDIEKDQREVDQMKLNLANERVLLTPELIEEREEEIKIKEDEILDYQQTRFGPNGDLMVQRRQLVQPIQDQVFNIVQELAEAKKYDFIFDKSADVVMLFAAKRNDLSDEVLRGIERAGRRIQAENRKEQRQIALDERLDGEDGELSEREQEIQRKKEEREKEADQKKSEREAMLAQRQRERDSIRAAKKQEYEERRQHLLDERERRRDSIKNARENEKNPK